jgi:DNA invertase Pin-like site-specific DNA recombinase
MRALAEGRFPETTTLSSMLVAQLWRGSYQAPAPDRLELGYGRGNCCNTTSTGPIAVSRESVLYQKPLTADSALALQIRPGPRANYSYHKQLFMVHLVMTKCALYGRVSTKAEKGLQDPEVQLRQLRKFATTQKWKVTAEYVDHESGAKTDRPQFKNMMDAASRREFDVLLFWSLDRFSREGIVPVLTSLNHLTGYGVKYRSFQEAYIDTTMPMGDLIAAFAAKLAELERKRIQERVKAGLEKARADGKVLGRPRNVVDRPKVWALRDSGRSIREIAAALQLSHGTVQRSLQNRT